MTNTVEHDPDTTTWDCRVCGAPWPCEPARSHMIATMTPTELRIGQWVALESAAPLLLGMTMNQVWDRFLGWAGNPPV